MISGRQARWRFILATGASPFATDPAGSTTIGGRKDSRKASVDDPQKYLQEQPHPEEPIEMDPQIRLIGPAGGILLFSAASLHSAVPNTSGQTRFSIDFRTVHLDDLVGKVGAPNIDTAATGTSLRDFLRGNDFAPIPDDIVALYDSEPETDGELVFQPPAIA